MKFDARYRPEDVLADKGEEREYLRHAHLDAREGKGRLIASDGARLLAIPAELEPGDVAGPVTASVIASARSRAALKNDAVRVLCTGAALRPGDLDYEKARPSLDPPFPDVDPVLDEMTPSFGDAGTVSIGFDPRALAGLCAAAGTPDRVRIVVRIPREVPGNPGREVVDPIRVEWPGIDAVMSIAPVADPNSWAASSAVGSRAPRVAGSIKIKAKAKAKKGGRR